MGEAAGKWSGFFRGAWSVPAGERLSGTNAFGFAKGEFVSGRGCLAMDSGTV